MNYAVPDYYGEFQCVGGECGHNCCIGWEIDIDRDTLEYYRSLKGAVGRKLRNHIDTDGVPHFRLDLQERCPFLNGNNLCELIIELGEEALCDICAVHPRFCNEYPHHTEMGLGLCCEQAVRLIVCRTAPMKLCGAVTEQDGIFATRDQIFALLQDRSLSIDTRLDQLAAMFGKNAGFDCGRWCDILLSLERLDEKWTELLTRLSQSRPDLTAFKKYIEEREYEYEQLAVYCIFRHFASAANSKEAAGRALFAVFAVKLLQNLGAVLYSDNGAFTPQDQCELARLFSSEIEYSDQNLSYILNFL